ncbi:MAG: hypothetical protein GY801_52290 [bacterium]|nr:hypothetical protein [bacterium]
MERRLGELLRDAFDSRAAGDYGDWVSFSEDEVAALFEGMQEFIQAVRQLLLQDKEAEDEQ